MRQNYKKDEENARIGKKEAILRILSYLKEYKGAIIFATILALVSSLSKAIIPHFTAKAVDVNIASKDYRGLIITVSIAIFFAITYGLTKLFSSKKAVKISNDIVLKIRDQAYSHILSLPIAFFDSRPLGRIITRVIGDTDKLKEITKSLLLTLIPSIFMLVFLVIMMLLMNPLLTFASLIVAPLMALFCYLLVVKNYQRWENNRKKESNYTAFVFEDYSGIRPIQSFEAEKETEEESNRLLSEIKKAWVSAVSRADLMNVVVPFSKVVGYILIIVVAVKSRMANVGEIIAFISYVNLFWQPIRSLAQLYNTLVGNLSSASRVFEIIDEKSDLIEEDGAITLIPDKGEIEFQNVSFSYPDDEETSILKDLSFTVEGGKTVALVGPTGAGKTTIINLIMRFFDPTEGRVLIDGYDVKQVTFDSLRNTVTMMPQDSTLFSGTIRENLKYGKAVSDEEMEEKIKELKLTSLIASLPNGYDTTIKEAGLSNGQKQLIALARTLIASPKVLILDEATSSVDTRTELMVQEGLKILMKDRTSIIVAHRLSTIRNADEIFVVGNKGIIDRGTHIELMAKKGEYEKLYSAQFAFIEDAK